MDKNEIGSGAAGFLLVVFLSFIFIGAWAYHTGKEEVKKQAVRRGCGHFVTEDGDNVEFEWLHPVITKSEGK
jgi:hypothetical protein